MAPQCPVTVVARLIMINSGGSGGSLDNTQQIRRNKQNSEYLTFQRMLLLLVTIFQLLTAPTPALSSQDSPAAPILFIINSQPGEYHSRLADTSRQSILKQWKSFVPASLMKPPQVLLTTEMDPEVENSPTCPLYNNVLFVDSKIWVDDLSTGRDNDDTDGVREGPRLDCSPQREY